MTTKKLVITANLVSLFLLATLGVKYFLKKRESAVPGSQTPAQPTSITPSARQSDFDIPKGDKIEVGGIKVNNFYTNSPPPGQIGEILFVDEKEYKIIYFPLDDGFLIPILSRPFSDIKLKAEKAFLEALGIERNEACKLLVSITTPNYVNPDQASQNHKLSWCN